MANLTPNQHIRLECLKLANALAQAGKIVASTAPATAEKYEQFVREGKDDPPSLREVVRGLSGTGDAYHRGLTGS